MDQQDEDRQDGRQDDDMDDQDEEGRQEPLAGVDWSTERVRIVGAETAGVLTGESPGHTQAPGEPDAGDAAGRENQYLGFVHYSPPPAPPPLSLPPDGEELAVVPPEMPHWSEPATGQVPAVIDSRSDEEGDPAWAAFADSGPVWREHEHEWEDTGGFEPAMLADEETRVGALSESVSEESRPWEFDDLTPPGGEEVVAASVEEEVRDAEPFADTGEMEVGHKAAGGFWAERSGAFLSERGDDFGAHGGRFGEDHRLFEKPSHGRRGDEMEQPDPVGARGAAVAGSSWWDDEPASTPAASASTVPTMADPGSPGTPGAPGASVTRAVVTEHVEPNGLDAPGTASPILTADGPAEDAPAARSARVHAPEPPRRRPRRPPAETSGGGRDVPVAVASGLIAVGIVLGCFAAGSLATEVLAAVAVTLAAAETYAAFRRAGLRPATLVGLVATAGLMIATYDKGVAALPLIGALVVATTMIWYLIGADGGSPVAGISSTLFGFAWVGVLGSFAALLLAPSIYPHRHGVAFAFGAVVATVAADVGALAVGSWLGRHQLAPHVSPNKTWEGWAGGAVAAVLASAFITGHMHPWTPGKAAILGAVAAVVAPLGDLCESLVKRDLGIKDMGSIIPGHGGVLDRMDALLFVFPATYFLVRVLHLG